MKIVLTELKNFNSPQSVFSQYLAIIHMLKFISKFVYRRLSFHTKIYLQHCVITNNYRVLVAGCI